jgi:hypothetical protein
MTNNWLAEFLVALEKEMPQAEQEYVNAMIGIVGKYGKLANGDGNGIWVGYVEPTENDNLAMGIKCGNCAFYEGNGVCKIVAQKVEEDGYCRLAAIPDGVVKGYK